MAALTHREIANALYATGKMSREDAQKCARLHISGRDKRTLKPSELAAAEQIRDVMGW